MHCHGSDKAVIMRFMTPTPSAGADEESEQVRLIAPDGTPVSHPAYGVDLPPASLRALYEEMVVTRGLDEELVNLQRQGQLALYPSCEGHEAAQVGGAAALGDGDWIFPQYRELGAFLHRGVDPAGVGALWRGIWHGGLGLVERNIAPAAIPVGTSGLHAVGAAMAGALLGDGTVAMAFLGDGATSTGDAHEAFNLAAVFGVPCLFYVLNNQWAISVPVEEQTRARSIAAKAAGYGMPGVRVDGNDVLACYAVVRAAAQRVREGGAPELVEAVTYRIGPHTTSDDPTRYRSDEEVAAWQALEPIVRYRRYLERQGLWSAEAEDELRQRTMEQRTRLRAALFDAPDPDPLELFDHVYAEPTPDLARQRRELADELAAEG